MLRETAIGENAKSLNTSRKGNDHNTTNCLPSAVGGCRDNHVMSPELKQLLLLCTECSVCSFPYRYTSYVVFLGVSAFTFPECNHSFHLRIKILLQ